MRTVVIMNIKQGLATGLQKFPPLRWGLSLAVCLFAPQNNVGVVGAIFNDQGQVLLVHHVFRPDYPWGLPGGWVERAEAPARTIQRELEEELNLPVQIEKILFCDPQGLEKNVTTPPGLGLAYYCRARGLSSSLAHIGQAKAAYEVLSAIWVDPEKIECKLAALQQKAITLGKLEFEREQRCNDNTNN